MKLVLNFQSTNVINDFIKLSKNDNIEIINAKVEKMFFDSILVGDVNAFIIDNIASYSQKAINFIKSKHPYIPVIVISNNNILNITNADIYLPFEKDIKFCYSLIIKNIISYQTNFYILQKLTHKNINKIEFGQCIYDPNLKTLYYKNKEIKKFSEKAGGILELLSSNYGNLVKKELILKKVWLRTDYFASRSMDVYITNIRKVFKENKINLVIENYSKTGLILK